MYKFIRALNFHLVTLFFTLVFYLQFCSPILFDRIEYNQNLTHQIDKRQTSNCTKTQFTCKSRDCIEQSKLCDGIKDCKDGSDETIHKCKQPCSTFKFRCNDGVCVEMSAKCNGVKECRDGSDEHHCTGRKTKTTSKLTTKTTSKPTTKTTLKPVPTSPATLPSSNHICEVPSYGTDKKVVVIDEYNNLLNISRSLKVPKYSEIEITCNSKYSLLNGEKVQHAVCLREEKWNPPLEPCLKACPTLNAVNVELMCYRKGQVIDCSSDLVNGTRVRPICKSLYHKEKEVYFRELRCQENGEWDNELFRCVPDCGIPSTSFESLIFNGTSALVGDAPWNVAIYRISTNYMLICDGTLISENTVVSAAHCFFSVPLGKPANLTSDYEVVVSKYTRDYKNRDNSFQKTYQIRDIIFPDNGFNHYGNDVVVLVLKETVKISKYVLPACISMTDNFRPAEGTLGKLVGWGVDKKADEGSPILLSVELPYISYNKCIGKLKNITPDKFCAGSDTGPGAGKGDSGGGLMFRDPDSGHYFLRGIVSKRDRDSTLSIAAFTDISQHIDWLNRVRNQGERQLLEAESTLNSKGETFTGKQSCGHPSTSVRDLIFNGVMAVVGNSPWHVAIYRISINYTLICGGTLISDNMVVSAAHCFFDEGLNKVFNTTSDYEVVVNKYTRDYKTRDNDFQKSYQIRDIIFTDIGYNPSFTLHYGHDIVVLVLKETVKKNRYVLPACIEWNTSTKDGFQPAEGTLGKLVGWGVDKVTDVATSSLLSIELPYISYHKCVGKMEHITPDKFCAGSNMSTRAGAQKGDSGGGLMFRDPYNGRYFLRGIVSTRNRDREPNIATFTDISQHIDWLDRVRNQVERQLLEDETLKVERVVGHKLNN